MLDIHEADASPLVVCEERGTCSLQLRNARSGAKQGKPGAVTCGEVRDAHVLGIHQLGWIIDVTEAEHVSEFVHDDRAPLGRTVRAAGDNAGKIRGVKAYLSRGEDQGLPGGLCIAAPAESGNVSG